MSRRQFMTLIHFDARAVQQTTLTRINGMHEATEKASGGATPLAFVVDVCFLWPFWMFFLAFLDVGRSRAVL